MNTGSYNGLSPRVRGNPDAGEQGPYRWRSIPACAGEPSSTGPETCIAPVYPRVCGGTNNPDSGTAHVHGLSPRVRGNHVGSRVGVLHDRSIPACAGEPSTLVATPHLATVYPRVCGGTTVRDAAPAPIAGLSPRVRGNLVPGAGHRLFPGSIPACAGEPRGFPRWRSPRQVYPRVCGGTLKTGANIGSAWGLSPRVRGNPGPDGVSHL